MLGITGNKDIDRKILLTLSHEDLISVSTLNKYMYYNVCDDKFFYSRLFLSYPDTLKYIDNNKNYKKFYLKIAHYISKLSQEFHYSYTLGNPEKQYKIFTKSYYNNDILLNEASSHGEIELVKEAVKRGVNIHKNYERLIWASKYGHLNIVKYFVELGADIHAHNEMAIVHASGYGHLEVVKYLVEKGANIYTNNAPLLWACEGGHLEVIKYFVACRLLISPENLVDCRLSVATKDLLVKRVNIYTCDNLPLRRAVKAGHLHVVKYLVDLGANIHAQNEYPLRSASRNGYLEIVKYLVEHGANVHAENSSALRGALRYRHLNVVKYLDSL